MCSHSGPQEVPTNTCVDMVHQDNDSPYPTTNTPPLTTHHALNVCGALRRVCSCDDDRNGKEDDCAPDMVSTSDQFSWKKWRKAMILALKRQKPLTNALDGLYLSCADRILQVRWVEGRADTLRWYASV